MIPILSVVTSVKDYVEIVHKLIESDSSYKITNYDDLGPIITYMVITLKEFFWNVLSLNWLKSIWDLPIIIPDISSAMISEISVLDGYFHNAFNFLDTPLSYGDRNIALYSLEKFSIGLLNSLFLFIPTSTAHLITLRRFVIQGLEAGYLAGLGSIAGSILWITSVIFGWRFFVIPWLSLDVFRYLLGFVLLVKYMWDTYNERKTVIASPEAKQKIFLLNFLLALTEQTSVYPFISNISIGSESSILESFPAQNFVEFISIHGFYIAGLTLGCLSLLHFTCWFWENPGFKIYMWLISSFKVSTSFYYKVLNFTFLYLTMICAISSIPYYGLDYTLTNPLGFIQDDRILDEKSMLETSFLNSKASDRNTRRNRGRHGRRERWKRRIRKYRTFDASLYDDGIYDLFTIEDLNYGFDRFWLRRKMRNHRVRFRFFPGPWMRSFKKQLAKPRLESYAGPRQEFFRILFEQVYHPSFHEYETNKSSKDLKNKNESKNSMMQNGSTNASNQALANEQKNRFSKKDASLYYNPIGNAVINASGLTAPGVVNFNIKEDLKVENSTLRKFVRKLNTRIKSAEIKTNFNNINLLNALETENNKTNENLLYSKRWKQLFSRISHEKDPFIANNGQLKGILRNFYQTSLTDNSQNIKKQNSQIFLTKKEQQVLKYRSLILNNSNDLKNTKATSKNSLILLHPLKFYLKKQQAFERKLRYYTPTIFRKFSIENNAPYFRVMMKRYFYYYKPTLRWERTMKVASMRKARRKTPAVPRKLQLTDQSLKNLTMTQNNSEANQQQTNELSGTLMDARAPVVGTAKNRMTKPTHNYTIVGKRATRYRYQIYKDVLQHWYYSPFNRFLLKLDVDLFIKRQPNTHFLTKNEENLLHLRRFLLSEHYDTLRWYTYMQHYRSMKTKIGGTKSFASGVYNQQFKGTFKKIRHLFAITPSQGNQTVLKFDQPLYNEYPNTSNNNYQKNLIIHEELLQDNNNSNLDKNMLGKDLVNQSTDVIRNYLIKSDPIKQEYIKKLIEEKNYLELTKFLYKGQKTRGVKPTTNEKSFLAQEKDYLLTTMEVEEFENLEKLKIEKFLRPLQQDLWVNLLKKWKRKVNDQEFLKNYLQRRIEKREKRKQKKEKNLKTKFQRLEKLLPQNNLIFETEFQDQGPLENNLSSGIQKALIDGANTLTSQNQNLLKLTERQFNNQKFNWNQTDQINKSINSNKTTEKALKDTSLLQKEIQFQYSLNKLSKIIKESKQSGLLNKNQFQLRSINLKQVSNGVKNLYKKYQLNCNNFINKKVVNIFKPIRQNNFKNWQKQERALNKQKRVRKEFKAFSKKSFNTNPKEYLKYLNQNSDISLNTKYGKTEPTRKKRDFTVNEISSANLSLTALPNEKNTWKTDLKNTYMKYFTKKFKRKKSPQRRARIRRNRGVIRKRSLSDSLKREFKNLRRYNLPGDKIDNKKQKIYLSFNSSINSESVSSRRELSDGLFKEGNLQRRGKQRKQRFWKQKRAKYSQKLRKYRKRRRSVLGKVRILNKQLQRIKLTTDLKNWWWKNFLPNLRATTDSLWQYEKDRQIQQKLLELSVPEILERNEILNNSSSHLNSLQIGNFDYKPLGLPETIKLRENLLKETNLINENQKNASNFQLNTELNTKQLTTTSEALSPLAPSPDGRGASALTFGLKNENQNQDIVSNVMKVSFSNPNLTNTSKDMKSNPVIPNNPIPFYAGWDESLRKFVVTNRLLSRRDSGYQMNTKKLQQSDFQSLSNEYSSKDLLSFTAAPLKGMNAATTLYWQIPFTTYDPDQFFALGLDGFAPLGWRRFQFRHSILKSWLYQKTTPNINKIENNSKEKASYIVKNQTTILGSPKTITVNSNKLTNSQLLYKLKLKHNPINNAPFNSENNEFNAFNKKNTKNVYRRLKKRYRRVKKHPRSPVWFPSGPLLNQVLPVHYIYIFYKRSRLPRDRYIKRRLRKSKSTTNLYSNNQNFNNTQIPDFTLRKRVKTKRKYHIKQDLSKKSPIIPRRLKLIGNDINQLRWRPLSRQKLNKPIAELIKEQRALKYKQRKKENQDANSKQAPNIRMKQLRRRVQRQIIRSAWRYRPRAGGFVWPGDYLKLELVKAPKLNSNNQIAEMETLENNKLRSGPIKVKRKKKRNLQEWQIQPKKYLLQRHNYNVIKKKLEKAQRSNKLPERVKELNYLV